MLETMIFEFLEADSNDADLENFEFFTLKILSILIMIFRFRCKYDFDLKV